VVPRAELRTAIANPKIDELSGFYRCLKIVGCRPSLNASSALDPGGVRVARNASIIDCVATSRHFVGDANLANSEMQSSTFFPILTLILCLDHNSPTNSATGPQSSFDCYIKCHAGVGQLDFALPLVQRPVCAATCGKREPPYPPPTGRPDIGTEPSAKQIDSLKAEID
jgi:hypothetical protein